MARPVSETEPGWGRSDHLIQPRNPVFWLAVALMVFGALLVHSRVAPALGPNVGPVSIAFVLWAAYTAPFVVLIVALDLLEPEPPAFLASAFAWGALVATSVSLVANGASRSILTKTAGAAFTETWWAALSGPTTEEVMKALGVVVVVVVARRQVTTVLDGLVYGLFVGLGFQVVENLVYTTDRLQFAPFGGTPGGVIVDMFVLRGLALGLWSHAAYTALAGFGIAYAAVRSDLPMWRRAVVPGALLLLAWALHFVWNAPFFQPDRSQGLTWASFSIYVLKGVPALALVVVLYTLARRREVEWLSAALSHESCGVSEDEIATLSKAGARRAARTEARRRGGRDAEIAVRRLQRAQIRLAVARATGGPDDPAIEAAHEALEAARAAVVS